MSNLCYVCLRQFPRPWQTPTYLYDQDHLSHNLLPYTKDHEIFTQTYINNNIQQQERMEWITGVINDTEFPPENDQGKWNTYFDSLKLSTTPTLIVLEKDNSDTLHLHYITKNNQRTDNFIRSFKKKTLTNIYNLNITAQKVKNFTHILQYLTKQPIYLYSNNSALTMLHQYFKENTIQKNPVNKIHTLKDLATKITDLIQSENIQNYQTLVKNHHDLMHNFLHINNIHNIFKNCLEWVNITNANCNFENIIQNYKTCTNADRKHVEYILLQNDINIQNFAQKTFKILTKNNNKKNTIVLEGIPNSGKSSLARAIVQCFPKFGEVTNTSNFMWADLLHKPIGICEEPIFNEICSEKLKLIMEGSPTQIDIKHKGSELLEKIPLIITTNHELWTWVPQNKNAYIQRCVFFAFINEIHVIDTNNCPADHNTNPTQSSSTSGRNENYHSPHKHLRRRLFDNSTPEQQEEEACTTPTTSNKRTTALLEANQTPTKKQRTDEFHLIPHPCDIIKFYQHYVLANTSDK